MPSEIFALQQQRSDRKNCMAIDMLTQAKHCLPTVNNVLYEEAFKICTVKEQHPGFTGLVKRVDTVAETRVVLEICSVCSIFLFYIYN